MPPGPPLRVFSGGGYWVRLDAVVAATWYDVPEPLAIVNHAKESGTDSWSEKPIEAAAARLKGKTMELEEENPMPKIPTHLTKAEQKSFKAGHEVYFRDAHCATCHQPDGKGLDPAFPPLAGSIFVTGDPERLVKITLHGLMGPINVNGKFYNGQVPMTPFGGMLNDHEVADVLTYIRNHFGNKASAVSAQQVKKVREETKGVVGFYQVEQLLKEHPLEE